MRGEDQSRHGASRTTRLLNRAAPPPVSSNNVRRRWLTQETVMTNRLLCFVVAGLLAGTSSSEACSCGEIGEGTPGLAQYTAVFEGTVVAVSEILMPRPERESFRPMRLVVFHSERVWKGAKQPVFWLYTGQGAADCGYPFEVGERYLVFAGQPAPYQRDELNMRKRDLVAPSCSHTAPVTRAGELVSHLNRVATAWAPDFKVRRRASNPAPPPGWRRR